MDSIAPVTRAQARSNIEPVLTGLTLTACVTLFLYKVLLVFRININWDEFWYLNFVHALARDELTLVLQGAYTHLFRWLPGLAVNEADQIVAARLVMVALLGITTWLIWLLGRRWMDGLAAAAPPLIYLALAPVAHHGGSFRADSLLVPLLMGALVVLVRTPRTSAQEVLAGVLLGLACAVSVKALLFAPMVILFVVALPTHGRGSNGSFDGGATVRSLTRIGLVAGVVAIAIVAVHSTTVATLAASTSGAAPAETVGEFATRTATATLLNSPLFARVHLLRQYALWQPLPWLLCTLGLIAALHRRKYELAALGFALLPIAIYRNSYPYFYVVMMAPTSVLAGFAIHSMRAYVVSKAPRWDIIFASLLWLGLMYQSFAYIGRLWQDNQAVQRQIIAGAHQIFPRPVNYIDRCGMIASFRKTNFFMSTWGLEEYRSKAVPFVPTTLANAMPAFVLMNTSALSTGRPRVNGLLEVDRVLLQQFYPRYWGPIRVAGAVAHLQPGQAQDVEVPFAAKYRIESSEPIQVDGVRRYPGDVIDIERRVRVEIVTSETSSPAPAVIKLFLASANERPTSEPDPQLIFTGL